MAARPLRGPVLRLWGAPRHRRRRGKAGERLPPARDLAAVIGVNTNNVLRALRTLRDEGLLEFRRGRGITVAAAPEQGAVTARARELISFARQHGYSEANSIAIIESLV